MAKKNKIVAVLAKLIALASIASILVWMWFSSPGYKLDGGEAVVEKAFYDRQSELMVEVTGTVFQMASQNASNAGYQEFRMKLPSGQLLTIVHENKRGQRLPLEANDTVTVRGQYYWNELGGIIKGTQRDNSMERLHGWIEHDGVRYD